MSSPIKRLPLHPIPAVLDGLVLSTEQYKYFASIALKNELELKPIDYSTFETKPFSLNPVLITRLTDIANKQFGGDIKEAFAALCAAAIAREVAMVKKREESTKHVRVKLPFTAKSPLQEKYFQTASKAILDGSIVLAEGSTGIGKGRVLAAIAVIKAKDKTNNPGPIVLTAPTVATMEQLYGEMQQIEHDESVCILPGATEFVDDLLLCAYLEEEDRADLLPIRDWVAAGAPALNAQRPLVKALNGTAAWLAADLNALSDSIADFDANSFTLRADLDLASSSRDTLRLVKDKAKNDAKIIICTHAMLGLSQKNKWALFPAPRFLIVDEAHIFESAISLINSKNVSMLTLRSQLAAERRKNGSGPRSGLGLAHSAVKDFSQFLRSLKTDKDSVGLEKLHHAQLLQIIQKGTPLLALLKAKSCAKVPLMSHFIAGISLVLQRANDLTKPSIEKPSESVYVTFSKVRNFPSFLASSSNVAAALGALWKSSNEGVVLASATLYAPTSSGDLKFDYLRTLLNTPVARTVMATPVVDPAIYTIPTLHLPSKASASALRIDNDNRDPWFKAQAKTIAQRVLPHSLGGTLVLCTSYQDMDGIAKELTMQSVDRPIITMQRGMGFASAAKKYKEAYLDGLKPVFLALGPAWTGVDLSLSEIAPENDLLLTALVITKMPVGLNNSNTMQARVNRMGFYAIEQESLLTLKQGLGRLIRRVNVTNRHLWVLDGRLFDGMPWSTQNKGDRSSTLNAVDLKAAALRMLLNYKSIENFQ